MLVAKHFARSSPLYIQAYLAIVAHGMLIVQQHLSKDVLKAYLVLSSSSPLSFSADRTMLTDRMSGNVERAEIRAGRIAYDVLVREGGSMPLDVWVTSECITQGKAYCNGTLNCFPRLRAW